MSERSTPPKVVDAILVAARRPGTYIGHAREFVSVARCVAHYPMGLVSPPVVRRAEGAAEQAPVLLVHGYGHNRSGWFVLERHLAKAGFGHVDALNYSPLRHDVPELAEQLARRVERLRADSGAERVHLVGHSLGGLVVRWYVQELGGDATVDRAVTIATPHQGTVAAFAAPGRTAEELRPGSWVMRRLADGARPSPVRWVAYYSNVDLLVQPASSAMLTHPALAATNVLAKDHGHLSLMLSPWLSRSVVQHLQGSTADRSAADEVELRRAAAS
ncbi:MAG TPA: alpha/beta fold hydrolase [Acidimicrobiales bacterium]|nr:alpha/beta fold hydrolase [Acidimicrobiales bacterium]